MKCYKEVKNIISRILFLFGLLFLTASLIFLIMSLFGGFDGIINIVWLFGILNSLIAIGVSDIINKINKQNAKE
ncbi:hypothetical protein DNH61_02495 [Paenibacillus sambharensis]|uniref:Uncharacterized protein n=1 Tax=Paenibacillus sambharensis TaxID=1803190 RepID=A0A2W1LGQ7_9BACL|nr:hypothetical protein DNH61_02495 [Paenibacillus sambharensis]